NETYKSISEKTGIPQTTVEKLFCGRTKEPKLNTIKEVVHCLGYTLDDLVGEPKNQEADIILTEDERNLVLAYRVHPEMQAAVNKMLDISPDKSKIIADDIISELKQAATIQSIKSDLSSR
ncbi:MAG: helix-turn-helix transcriptional regulator, partial [Firmicutes bacterium]|nr:helix-turn-helix transcriptional regulator [Bacillota bacterium]